VPAIEIVSGPVFLLVSMASGCVSTRGTARADFAELDMPLHVVEITLDVAPLCARFGMWEKLKRVAAEAIRLLGDFPESAQAVAAYDLWAQAVAAEDDVYLAELTQTCHTAIERLRSVA
jgi:hypothetical protein